RLCEAESALWRVFPNTHIIPSDHPLGKKTPDPFEGPGETYRAAYERMLSELAAWKKAAADYPDVSQALSEWRERAERAEAQRDEALKALDALDRMNRGVDWCDHDEQARRWSAARRALEGGE